MDHCSCCPEGHGGEVYCLILAHKEEDSGWDFFLFVMRLRTTFLMILSQVSRNPFAVQDSQYLKWMWAMSRSGSQCDVDDFDLLRLLSASRGHVKLPLSFLFLLPISSKGTTGKIMVGDRNPGLEQDFKTTLSQTKDCLSTEVQNNDLLYSSLVHKWKFNDHFLHWTDLEIRSHRLCEQPSRPLAHGLDWACVPSLGQLQGQLLKDCLGQG